MIPSSAGFRSQLGLSPFHLLQICFFRCRLLPCGLAMLLAMLLSVTSWPSTVSAQEPILEQVPTTAFAGISLKPKSMLSAPDMEYLPTELVQMFGQKELGLELLELEELLAVVDPPEDPEMTAPPKFAVIARFATEQELGGNVIEHLTPTEFDGLPGYRVVEDIGVAKLDERTFIMAPEDWIVSIAKASGNQSPLIELLQSTDNSTFAVHVLVEPVRQLIKDNLPPENAVPPPFNQLLTFPDLIDSISYAGPENGSNLERLTIRTVDEEAGEQVVRTMNSLLRFGKNMAMGWLQREEVFADPDYEQALMQYAERMAGKIQTLVQPQVDGNTLVYNIEGRGNLGTVGSSSMLIGLLLPAVQQAREAARRAQSMNNIKQLLLSLHNYHATKRHFPAQFSVSQEGKPLLSWRVHILPYIEQQELYEQFHLDEPWDSEHNLSLLNQMPMTFVNPNVDSSDWKTVYLAVSGKDAMFEGDKKIQFSDILDGASNTSMIVEVNPDQAVYWTQPADWECDPADPLAGLGGIRVGGFLIGWADGAVEMLPLNIDPNRWAETTTRNSRDDARNGN